MKNLIKSIALDKLIAHPNNPNKMSKVNFAKLICNIKRTDRYEPIIVRNHPENHNCFEIINGYHRCKALEQLGYKEVDCVVWEVNDEEVDIFLLTLNRLGGSDELEKKAKLLKQLNERMASVELAKLVPQTAKQIERFAALQTSRQISFAEKKRVANCFANPMVFFLADRQKQTVENALSLAEENKEGKTKAQRNAAALIHIAQYFLSNSLTSAGMGTDDQKETV